MNKGDEVGDILTSEERKTRQRRGEVCSPSPPESGVRLNLTLLHGALNPDSLLTVQIYFLLFFLSPGESEKPRADSSLLHSISVQL